MKVQIRVIQLFSYRVMKQKIIADDNWTLLTRLNQFLHLVVCTCKNESGFQTPGVSKRWNNSYYFLFQYKQIKTKIYLISQREKFLNPRNAAVYRHGFARFSNSNRSRSKDIPVTCLTFQGWCDWGGPTYTTTAPRSTKSNTKRSTMKFDPLVIKSNVYIRTH